MNSTDPASLQNLNDIVLPADPAWWPLAQGWYFLIGSLLVLAAWFGYRWLRYWLENRYRRAALSELRLLADGINKPEKRDTCLRQIPTLLKRTALSVYSRDQVASLSGEDWRDFLNSKAHGLVFTEATFATLDSISYSCGELNVLDSQEVSDLLLATKEWLNRHLSAGQPKSSKES
jgi:hypothetical protein